MCQLLGKEARNLKTVRDCDAFRRRSPEFVARLRHPHSGGVFHRSLSRSGTAIKKGRGFLAESKHYHPIVGFVSSRVKRASTVNLTEVPSQLTHFSATEADQSTEGGNMRNALPARVSAHLFERFHGPAWGRARAASESAWRHAPRPGRPRKHRLHSPEIAPLDVRKTGLQGWRLPESFPQRLPLRRGLAARRDRASSTLVERGRPLHSSAFRPQRRRQSAAGQYAFSSTIALRMLSGWGRIASSSSGW